MPEKKKKLTKRNFPQERSRLRAERDTSLMHIAPMFPSSPLHETYQRDSERIKDKYEEALKKLNEEELRAPFEGHEPKDAPVVYFTGGLAGSGKLGAIPKEVRETSVIIDANENKKPFESAPKIIFLGGLPGSGKSTAITDDVKENNVIIDANETKKFLINKANDTMAWHKVSAVFAKHQLKKAVTEKYDTVYNSQLCNYEFIKDAIEQVLAHGGHVSIIVFDASPVTSQARVLARYMSVASNEVETDKDLVPRDVPYNVTVKGHNHVLPTFLQFLKDYDDNPNVDFKLYDNDTDFSERQLIMERTDGQVCINGPAKYARVQDIEYVITEEGRTERKEKVSEAEFSKITGAIARRAGFLFVRHHPHLQELPEAEDLAERFRAYHSEIQS